VDFPWTRAGGSHHLEIVVFVLLFVVVVNYYGC
jgi:hypothetical protein